MAKLGDYLVAEQLSRAERVSDYLTSQQLSRSENIGDYLTKQSFDSAPKLGNYLTTQSMQNAYVQEGMHGFGDITSFVTANWPLLLGVAGIGYVFRKDLKRMF